jgi:UDP-3-O-[3-hydroxymyristoyl] N-acetylglucosamine deacetylase
MAFQQTIKNKLTLTGVGLHSGKETIITLRPAEAGTGVVFHRVDLTPSVSIEARPEHVVSTRLSTTIGKESAVVATIEHLMAALYCCGIDNIHIDINGPEVPIMDGSASPFIKAMMSTGTRSFAKPRKYLVIKKPVTISEGDKSIAIVPSRDFRVTFDMHFNHPVVNSQFKTMTFNRDEFASDFAPARTFGFLAEVETLKAHGLALGGSLENAVVISDTSIMNPEGLRYEDEFVRHKILDSVGDFALTGYQLVGHIKGCRSGHDLNHKLVTELLSRPDCWELVEDTARTNTPFIFPSTLSELSWSKA